jgi:protein-L-isoaspartate(D-aspartate) O-methyltransferase
MARMGRDELVALLTREGHEPRVLRAIAAVPRDLFVPGDLQGEAWENTALPIGEGQTISQPSVVARMCELLELRGDEKVLDVGTGSGYHAAVLAQLVARVISIEIYASLSRAARRALEAAGVTNVTLITGDGSRGHPDEAPFDAINVAAASYGDVPAALIEQLTDAGRMVIPCDHGGQRLLLLRRRGGSLEREEHERVRFVPLVTGDRATPTGS